MGLLKSGLKYKGAKKVTDKAVGKGTLSTLAATKMVKKSNKRNREQQNEKH